MHVKLLDHISQFFQIFTTEGKEEKSIDNCSFALDTEIIFTRSLELELDIFNF